MSIDVRPAEDAEKYLATDQLVWFGEVSDSDADNLRLGLPEDQRFAVDLPDGPEDLHSGIYGVRPMEMSLPGGSVVPIAGLTWVGVHPDSRRRGVLAAMMTDHLTRTRDAGLAVSALHASEAGIYGRFGYGMAALQLQVSIGRGTTFTAPHLEDEVAGITTQLVSMGAAGVTERMRACQVAHAARLPRHDHRLAGLLRPPGLRARRDSPRQGAPPRPLRAPRRRGRRLRRSPTRAQVGPARDPPARSPSAPSAAPRRRGWPWRDGSSTST